MKPVAAARATMAVSAVTLAIAACAGTNQVAPLGVSASTRGAATQTAQKPRTTASPRRTAAVPRYNPCAPSFPGMRVGRPLADLYAGSLLCEFAVPQGARRLAIAPDTAHGVLTQSLPQALLADEVDRAQFWQIPGNPQGVLAWEKLHLPRSLAYTGSGSGSLAGTTIEWQDDYSLPAVPQQPLVNGQIDSRTMSLFAVDAGNGQTYLEVAVSVDWIPPRPASEVIPQSVRAVEITAVPDMNLYITAPAPVTITNPARVRRIVALIDSLPLSPPGVFSCPFGGDAELVLTFLTQQTGGSTLAVADLGLEGCEWISLTIGGKQQPGLGAPNGGRSFAAGVLRAAGVSWNLSKLVI
jgi:hypothetical protein